MDPYLEEPSRWGGVHSRFINSISDRLAAAVSPHFIVDIEDRVYITVPEVPDRRPIVPDVYVIKSAEGSRLRETAVYETAIITETRAPTDIQVMPIFPRITAPMLIEPLYDEEIRDHYIEIRDARGHEVVTTLEVLSPFNKTAGTPGRRGFLRKRKAVMSSKTHWIEIDLLRAGLRPAEVADKSDYYALLKRGGMLSALEVWCFDLRDALPTIAVPLRPPFADVPLDLAAVVDDVYARGRYADSLDYTTPLPDPPLRPADVTWAAGRVREWIKERPPASQR
jgi:hypothetical protein